MLKIRDFKCNECSNPFEVWVEDDKREVKCMYCGGVATRLLSAPRCFQNTVGKSPSTSKRK